MKKYDHLRPAAHVVFAAKIWNGRTLYHVDGCPVYFGTKKDASAYIREHFSGDAAAVRLYDLRNAGRINPRRVSLPAVFEDEKKVAAFSTLSRAYRYLSIYKLCLDKVWNGGRGCTHLLQVSPGEKKVYYNTLTARRADIQRIEKTWPSYQPVAVDLPYWETLSLKSYFQKTNNN